MKRWAQLSILSGLILAAMGVRAAGDTFDFQVLRQRAKVLASKPYVPPLENQLPDWLRKMNYDDHRIIEFVADRSLWRREKLPFQLQFFHPGYMFDKAVQVFQVIGQRAELIPFSRDYFDYHTIKTGDLPPSMGFAGFRLIYPLNRPDDELGAFLGASYFRFLCERAVYGLSARGLALNTGEPEVEEFPRFADFWIERPSPRARAVTLYALLDSESVAGAYRFQIEPGADTVMDVQVALFCRKNPKVLGLAPLTSMYWRGENSNARTDDFRPEVHDSDGLLINTGGGEWIWRPLTNPAGIRVATFADEKPRGFGVLQRDRNFDHYQDLEARYHLRPSAWIEPVGNWGDGVIRLVELPTTSEYNDNIVAFWTPTKLPAPGEAIEFQYRLHWFLDQIRPSAGYTRGTRHHHDYQHERFLVDFGGADLEKMSASAAITPVVTVGTGAELTHTSIQKNPYDNSWRVTFVVKPGAGGQPVEMRCALRNEARVLTETWSYLWQP